MSDPDLLEHPQQLRRALSSGDLLIYGLIFMVPIAPFAVFGFVWHDSHGMVPLAYLFGLLGMSFTATSYAAMARAFPSAGSVYSYVQRGINPLVGFFSGWLILLDYILVPATSCVFATVALRPLTPEIPGWAWLLVFIGCSAVVNLLGVRLSARVNRSMFFVQLLVLGLFVVLGLSALYHGQGAGALTLHPLYNPPAFSMATIAGATSIAVLSFLGFDAISTLAEENAGSREAVARATLLSLLVAALLFMLQTWIATDLAQGMQFRSLETAFYDVAEQRIGSWLRNVMVIVNVAAAVAGAMAAQAAVSRILFAMARDGRLPAALSRVHRRYRTPHISTLTVSAISLAISVAFASRVDDLSRVINFGALTGFLLIHLAVIRHFFIRERSGNWLRHLLMPLAGFLVIGYVLYEMDGAAKIMGACWIAAGVVYYVTWTITLKKPVALEIS